VTAINTKIITKIVRETAKKTGIFLEMIKFSHTIFALPFALTGALLAAGGFPTIRQTIWIILAMVGARTAAMAMNRLIDAEIDARNPRTAVRAIPAGLIGRGLTLFFIVAATVLMMLAAQMLNPLCLKLSPIALFFLLLYSYCKRFTAMAHVVLGICLAAAPIGAWVAIRGSIEAPALVLGGVVVFWVAGFDRSAFLPVQFNASGDTLSGWHPGSSRHAAVRTLAAEGRKFEKARCGVFQHERIHQRCHCAVYGC
jgi:putative 4-hydroxybenzoate polyprenyltransferase